MNSSDPVSAVLQHKSAEIWSTMPDATVYEAIELMAEKDVGALLVLDKGKLLGLVSERDYTREVVLKEKSSRTTSVREIMKAKVVCVEPGDSVQHCMEIMTTRRFRHLPVVSGGEVMGIISIGDLVKWIISAQDALIGQLENFITGSYPA